MKNQINFIKNRINKKNKSVLSFVFLILLLSACNSNSKLEIKSDSVSQKQINIIIKNIQTKYPKLDHHLQQQILDVAVRAIENMVFVKGGSFMMGDFRAPCDAKDAKRMNWTPEAKCLSSITSRKTGADHLHKVTLNSYSLSKYETSMADFDTYLQTLGAPYDKEFVQQKINGSPIKRDSKYYEKIYKRANKRPAKTKKWQQAKDYCQWLGKLTDQTIDLPTEAQWEYAARNRGKNIYYATKNGYLQYRDGHYFNSDMNAYMDYKPDEWNFAYGVGHIARWAPNPLGIYDLTGNAWEWVNDWYSSDYYMQSPELNPQGPESGKEKVIRGFNDDNPVNVSRGHKEVTLKDYFVDFGFRCSLQSDLTNIHH